MSLEKRYKLISCEILFREVSLCAAKSDNVIDITFIEKALHDIGSAKMSSRLQAEIDKVDPSIYDAILLGYGLCNNGISSLYAPLPIVVPRGHDCITLLLGSKKRYATYFEENPGTYFKSSGWIERDVNPNSNEASTTSQLGMGKTYEEYVELYSEENAEFLSDMLGNWLVNYKKAAFINTHVGNIGKYRTFTQDFCKDKNWEYEEIEGDTRLLQALVDGAWNDDEFLIIPPGHRIQPANDDTIVKSEAL